MPRYTYGCNECDNEHEEIHSIKDDPKIICPKCGSTCSRLIGKVYGYIKGNCYLNKKDAKIQKTLSTLQDADPYAKLRQPGEAEDLANKIKNKSKNKKTVQINGSKKK